MTCDKCRFYCELGADHGTCRRYPPTPVMYSNGVFPNVEAAFAKCGEFQRKDKESMKRKVEK